MGGGEVTAQPISFTEVFEEQVPHYMAMGMTYDQFWHGEPGMVKFFRKAEDLRRRRKNQELWLEGVYMAEALQATVGNMFSKGAKHQYPSEPLAITLEEQRERQERERKARMEQIKAKFMAKALTVNTKMGGKADGQSGKA